MQKIFFFYKAEVEKHHVTSNKTSYQATISLFTIL